MTGRDGPHAAAGAGSGGTGGRRVAVGVAGGSGYTGLELLRILRHHPGVRVVFAGARSGVGEPSPVPGLDFSEVGPGDVARLDLLFCCLPHGTAAPWVAAAREAEVRCIDLTADHRPGSGGEEGVVYGMAELDPEGIAGARVVANPGCYPTGVILALHPLVHADLVDGGGTISIAAASGVTGAGRTPKRELLFAELHGDMRPYGLGNRHRHLKEMRALLPGLRLLFVPHLLPVARGIVETITLPVRPGVDAARIRAVWEATYERSPVVRVAPEAPTLARVAGTDLILLGAFDNEGLDEVVTVVVALDNLGKGAAGQAVQNMNLMLGRDPGEALRRG